MEVHCMGNSAPRRPMHEDLLRAAVFERRKKIEYRYMLT